MEKINTYTLKPYEVEYYSDHKDLAEDGRHIGRVAEDWWSKLSGGKRQSENSSFDVLEADGTRTEIRSAIKTVSFAASKQTGYGRKVTEKGFLEKLEGLDRFLVVNSTHLFDGGYVEFWALSKDEVLELGLGKNKKMSAKKFWGLVDNY